MKKILLCPVPFLACLLGFALYTALVKPLFENPLLRACRVLAPGMNEAEAVETVQEYSGSGETKFLRVDPSLPLVKSLMWANFNPPLWVRNKTLLVLPVSLHYRNDASLNVWVCGKEICDYNTNYRYETTLLLEVDTPTTQEYFMLYSDTGTYYLQNDCEPKK